LYILQVLSAEKIPFVIEALVKLTLEHRSLNIWLFVAYITDDFTLGLDILLAHDFSVDVGSHVLRLGQK
jgi:hypothetical protein